MVLALSLALVGAGAADAAADPEVMVALKPRDPSGMAALAKAVSTPGSPEYRHDLSVTAFARRFGERTTTVTAVERSLRRHGLTPRSLSSNHLTIYADGSTAGLSPRSLSPHIAAILDLSVRTGVGTPASRGAPASGGAFARARAGSGGKATAPHASRALRRHRDLSRSLGPLQVVSGGPHPCLAAVDAVSPSEWGPGWTANQVADGYDFSPLYWAGDKGQGVTVALYEQEPNLPRDVTTFERCYGINTSVRYVKVDGGSGRGPGVGEAIGDIDQITSLAPDAKVIVYDGPANTPGNSDPVLDTIVSQDRAQVIASSWGDCEPEDGIGVSTVDDNLLQEAAIQGQTFVVATGDDGAEDCFQEGSDANKVVSVDSPASSPWATGVGGTLLTSIAPHRETVWNNTLSRNLDGSGTPPGSGGGGISTFWQMPAYQSGAPQTLNVIRGASSGTPCRAPAGVYCREVPDVSAEADPMDGYATYFDGAWETWGGTSSAVGVWAAVFALADANPGCARARVGFANPKLYSLAGTSQASYFNDVTTGDNDVLNVNGGNFAAGPGYDMASGLGTPRAAALVNGFCGRALQLRIIGSQRSLQIGQRLRVQLHTAPLPSGVTALRFSRRRSAARHEVQRRQRSAHGRRAPPRRLPPRVLGDHVIQRLPEQDL